VFLDGVFLAGQSGVAFAREVMFYRILAYDLLADFARGSGGKFGIRLIGGDLRWSGHFRFSCWYQNGKGLRDHL
jgi:hypothetical protein